jgi:hypothetical protein
MTGCSEWGKDSRDLRVLERGSWPSRESWSIGSVRRREAQDWVVCVMGRLARGGSRKGEWSGKTRRRREEAQATLLVWGLEVRDRR